MHLDPEFSRYLAHINATQEPVQLGPKPPELEKGIPEIATFFRIKSRIVNISGTFNFRFATGPFI